MKKITEMINLVELNRFAKKYLPSQGPLEYFVHHNTLHSFEEFEFYDALNLANSMYGAKTKKSLLWYHQKYNENRIKDEDLKHIINLKYPELRFDDPIVQHLLFYHEQQESIVDEIDFNNFLAKNINLEKNLPGEFKRANTFWDHISKPHEKVRLLTVIEALKTKFYSSYFDKGVAYWMMEDRDQGILASFLEYSAHLPSFGFKKILKNLARKIKEQKDESVETLVKEYFGKLHVPEEYQKNVYLQILLKNKGWAALAKSLEENHHYNPTKIKIDFLEYTLIEFLFEIAALEYFKQEKYLNKFEYKFKPDLMQEGFFRYLYAGLVKNAGTYVSYRDITESKLFEIWHEAYEWNLIRKTIQSLVAKTDFAKGDKFHKKIQIVTCIDDREESLRRHFEEVEPECETFGYAGHFGLNILFKGAHAAHFRPLCPVSVTPEFYVWEKLKTHSKQKVSYLGRIKYHFYHYSKIPFWGAALSILLSPFSLILFFLDTVFPMLSHKIQHGLDRLIAKKESEYELDYERGENSELKGYTIPEMGNVVYAMLNTIGLKEDFAPLIYICGHGSESLNNPHEAAHDCGACSGGRGAPNAKLFSIMANRKDVRKYITQTYQVIIPENTYFVGGYHNTCNDDLKIFNKSEIPPVDLAYLEELMGRVATLDAKERVRKFEDVSLGVNEEYSYSHVQARAHNLAQPRPEYGHATNAICIVGPRRRNRDIFFDRRAFLVSYDQENDEDLSTLAALVNSIVPVCAGINLEYYFSYVDREYFGSGVKQPHNITSLMGVMNGYKSDLRLGLPWQMVEIHEPVRIIIVIESELDKFQETLWRANSKNLVLNEWVRIIVATPERGFYVYENKNFIPFEMNEKPKYKKNYKNTFEIIKDNREIIDFKNIGSYEC